MFMIFALCMVIGGLFYFSDPLEYFNDYVIPENSNEIMLCFYQADIGSTNRQYYIITLDGTVKLCKSDYPMNYEKLLEFNKTEENYIKIEPLTDKQLQHLRKMNTDNCRIISGVPIHDQAAPEKSYKIIQKHEEVYIMKSIWHIYYSDSLFNNPEGEEKCKSKYTNEICDYIDYAVSEAQRRGL